MGTVDSAFSSIDLQGGPKNLGINGDHGATLSRVKCPQLPYLFSAIYRVLYTLWKLKRMLFVIVVPYQV